MRVFVGSSSESSAIGKDIADWLADQGLIPVLWDQPETFLAGDNILLRLIAIADEVDAAILVFGEDDRVDVRGQSRLQARDNVLIEFGLFAGKLGPERAIGCVVGEAHLPSDLLGLAVIKISGQSNIAYQHRLAAWCTRLRQLGPIRQPGSGETYQLLDEAFNALDDIYRAFVRNPDSELEILDYQVTLTIYGNGDCRIEEQRLQRVELGLHQMELLAAEGDSPVDGFYAIQPKAVLLDERREVPIIPVSNRPRRKRFLIWLDPAIPHRQEHRLQVSWTWPRMFAALAQGRQDEYVLRCASYWRIRQLTLRFVLDDQLPAVRIRPRFDHRGSIRDEVSQNASSSISWEFSNLAPATELGFVLKPV